MPNHSLPYRPCGKCVLTLAGLTLKGTLDPQVARGAADCMTKKPQKPIFEPILAYPAKYPVGTAGSFPRLGGPRYAARCTFQSVSQDSLCPQDGKQTRRITPKSELLSPAAVRQGGDQRRATQGIRQNTGRVVNAKG